MFDIHRPNVCEIPTNDFDSPAETIAELYRERWKVELFLKKAQAKHGGQGILRNNGKRCPQSGVDCFDCDIVAANLVSA